MKTKRFKQLTLGKPRRLSAGLTNHEHPAVAPDAKHIAFYAGEYGSIQIVVSDLRGRFARRLSPHGGNNTQPTWHPGCARLAFRHQHTTEHKWEIWEVDLLGSGMPWPVLASDLWHYKHPVWSPDGTQMAYFSDENSAGIFHLWVMDVEQQTRRQLTHGDTQNHCHPAFSPDGTRLAFHAYEGVDMREPPVTNLYELNLASGKVRTLTQGEGQCKHPFYLNDEMITFHHESNETGWRWLEALLLKKCESVLLTLGENNDKHPFPFMDAKGRPCLAWSSKKLGSELAGEGNTYDIFVARLKGF